MGSATFFICLHRQVLGTSLFCTRERFVGYGEALATFGAARGEHTATIFGSHAGAKTVRIGALAFGGLVSAFHNAWYALDCFKSQ